MLAKRKFSETLRMQWHGFESRIVGTWYLNDSMLSCARTGEHLNELEAEAHTDR